MMAPPSSFRQLPPWSFLAKMRIQSGTAKLTPKRKRSSDVSAPRAQIKVRKMVVRKIQKEMGPSSTTQEAPIVSQV
jgi:hypothetical protein